MSPLDKTLTMSSALRARDLLTSVPSLRLYKGEAAEPIVCLTVYVQEGLGKWEGGSHLQYGFPVAYMLSMSDSFVYSWK